MGSRWRKAKSAVASRLCVQVSRSEGDDDSGADVLGPMTATMSTGVSGSGRRSDCSGGSGGGGEGERELPLSTPLPLPFSSGGLRLSRTIGRSSSKRYCAICLGTMKPGNGHALFTAECSHVFHFHCITSNVKHGNQVCPVCRAKWKEIPLQCSGKDASNGRSRVSPLDYPQGDGWTTLLRRLPASRPPPSVHTPFSQSVEPTIYNDDESLDSSLSDLLGTNSSENAQSVRRTVEIRTFPQFPAVSASDRFEDFNVLIHLKARLSGMRNSNRSHSTVLQSSRDRAPVDLVTVLDISGSMSGTKLSLLKRAMGFVIHNLGPLDRLSVVSFSSSASRRFPLRRMSDAGRQVALQAVNALTASGGTNIAEGLRKGAKVLEERREKNPVCSIILLSDGQDTYNLAAIQPVNYILLLPASLRRGAQHGQAQIPVHSFGFGADHDAALMHWISEASAGTFSFIEAENVIQDAFAQCIGGLLSVVVQELQVLFDCVNPGVVISSVHAGSYASTISDGGLRGVIDVGDLYAEEERDFLVSVKIPICSIACPSPEKFSLLNVWCGYKDPVSKESVSLDVFEVVIQRPEIVYPSKNVLCLEVDRQKNRVRAAEAMARARTLAERGDLSGAVSVLGNERNLLIESVATRSGDRLSLALDAELKEMQERMATRQMYETSGRAYLLSGLSSHSWQRATARGDSTDTTTTILRGYQTNSMVDMLMRSQSISITTNGGQPNQQRRRPENSRESR